MRAHGWEELVQYSQCKAVPLALAAPRQLLRLVLPTKYCTNSFRVIPTPIVAKLAAGSRWKECRQAAVRLLDQTKRSSRPSGAGASGIVWPSEWAAAYSLITSEGAA